MILSRVNEIVHIAKIYMIVYKLEPMQAIECAIQDVERYLKEEINGRSKASITNNKKRMQ